MYGQWTNDPRERFIAQFDWDGAEPIYRADRIGPAYRVTADQYQAFIANYERRRTPMLWVFFVSVTLVCAVPLYRDSLSPQPVRLIPPTPLLGVLLISGLIWCLDRWLRHAPARALRVATPEAPALTGDERLARTIGERSWEDLFAEMAMFALLFPFLALVMNATNNESGWPILVLCVAMLALTLTQMLRKWLFERRRRLAI